MWKILTRTATQKTWRTCKEFTNHDEAIEEMARRASENPHRHYMVAANEHIQSFQIPMNRS